MNCPSCGTAARSDDAFCRRCGARLPVSGARPTGAPATGSERTDSMPHVGHDQDRPAAASGDSPSRTSATGAAPPTDSDQGPSANVPAAISVSNMHGKRSRRRWWAAATVSAVVVAAAGTIAGVSIHARQARHAGDLVNSESCTHFTRQYVSGTTLDLTKVPPVASVTLTVSRTALTVLWRLRGHVGSAPPGADFYWDLEFQHTKAEIASADLQTAIDVGTEEGTPDASPQNWSDSIDNATSTRYVSRAAVLGDEIREVFPLASLRRMGLTEPFYWAPEVFGSQLTTRTGGAANGYDAAHYGFINQFCPRPTGGGTGYGATYAPRDYRVFPPSSHAPAAVAPILPVKPHHRHTVGTATTTSWKTEQLTGDPSSIGAVTCPTASECLLGGTGADGRMLLLRSSDGGSTWDLAHVASPWASQVAPAAQDTIQAISCADVYRCVAVEDYHRGMALLFSSDAGVNWDLARVPAGISPSEISCTPQGQCLGAGSFPSAVLHSSDYGRSWTVVALPPAIATELSNLADETVVCTGANSCAIVGAVGLDNPTGALAVIATTDAGRTWYSRVSNVASPGELPSRVSCPATTYCVAADTTNLFRTTNGGRTWTEVFHGGSMFTSPGPGSNPAPGIQSLSCPTTQLCVGTAIFLADPSLAAWVGTPGQSVPASAQVLLPLNSSTDQLPPDVSCPSATTCFFYDLTSDNGVLVRWTGALRSAMVQPNEGLRSSTTTTTTTASPSPMPSIATVEACARDLAAWDIYFALHGITSTAPSQFLHDAALRTWFEKEIDPVLRTLATSRPTTAEKTLLKDSLIECISLGFSGHNITGLPKAPSS